MPEIVVAANRLREALASTAHARAKDPDRPVLLWHWLTPWSDGLDVVAADNYRVARFRLTLAVPEGWPTCLLPAGDANLLVAWLKGRGDDPVSLTLEGDVLVATCGDDSVRFRLAHGTPPNLTPVIEAAAGSQPFAVLNGRYVGDAGKAAYSVSPAGTVNVSRGTDERAPVVIEAGDYTEWIMPVRVPEGAL